MQSTIVHPMFPHPAALMCALALRQPSHMPMTRPDPAGSGAAQAQAQAQHSTSTGSGAAQASVMGHELDSEARGRPAGSRVAGWLNRKPLPPV